MNTFGFIAPGKLLSTNERLHYHARATRTLDWRVLTCKLAKLYKVPSFDRAHVTITFAFTDNRHRDVHNYNPTAKAIIDGLVDAGVLEDDCDCHMVGPDLRRGPKVPQPGPEITVNLEAACLDHASPAPCTSPPNAKTSTRSADKRPATKP